jgi:TRAP-type C4-dicarboxylate transport system substrate-binding protein
VQLFPGGQLGAKTRVIGGLQLGSVEVELIGAASFQTIDPKFGLVELPCPWCERAQAPRTYDGALGEALAKLPGTKNIVVLAWGRPGCATSPRATVWCARRAICAASRSA